MRVQASIRMIEWSGMNGIFSNPVVEYNLAIGAYSPRELEMLRAAARRRIFRVDGFVIRELLQAEAIGLSRSYQFGPSWDSYVQPMREADAKVILAHERLSREFLDVTGMEPLGPAGTYKHHAHVLGEGELIPQVVETEELVHMKQMTRSTAGRT